MYLSKTKKSKCGYWSNKMLDDNLAEVHGETKLVKDQKTLTFITAQGNPPLNPLIIFLTFPRKNHLFVTYASYTLLKVALTPLDALPIISKMTISINLLRYFMRFP